MPKGRGSAKRSRNGPRMKSYINRRTGRVSMRRAIGPRDAAWRRARRGLTGT